MSIHYSCLQQAHRLALQLSWERTGLHCCIFLHRDRIPAGEFFLFYIFLLVCTQICFLYRNSFTY